MGSPYEIDVAGMTIVCKDVRIGETVVGGSSGSTLSSTELAVLDAASNANAGTGKVAILGTSGAMTLAGALTVAGVVNSSTLANTGAVTVTSAGASALAVGLAGATNPVLKIDASTASQATGISITGAAASAGVAVAAISSAGAENLTINAKSTGTIGIGSVSTGAVTITPATTITGALTTSKVIVGAGTTAIAPINLTSGTNLTTAAAGAIEFDGDAFYATSQASSRQAIPAQQYIIQATEPTADNNAGLDTAVAAAVFTASTGAITLVAGKTYMFEGVYNLTNTGTTSHTWATAFGGGATFTATGTGYQVIGSSGVTAGTPIAPLQGFLTGATMSTAVVCTAASTSATEQVSVKVYGTLVVSGGGTLIPQMKASARPGASGTPGVLHKAGSYFRIWQVPTLGAVGNWS